MSGDAENTTGYVEPKKPKRERKPSVKLAKRPNPGEFNDEEVKLIKNHIAKDATETELAFCMGVAKRYMLDPFKGQIYFISRKDRSAEGGKRWVPIVGVGGLLHVAARDHKNEFGSNDEAEFGEPIDVTWTEGYWGKETKNGKEFSKWFVKATHTFKAPSYARVSVWKKRAKRPTTGTVRWQEVYPDVNNAPLVRQMPYHMLEKCALAKALRRAYPDTGGLYIKEEFMVEEYEESPKAIASREKVEAIDAKMSHFKELAAGKPPTEEQMSKLEMGASPEEVLLQDSLWPKGAVHSTELKGEIDAKG